MKSLRNLTYLALPLAFMASVNCVAHEAPLPSSSAEFSAVKNPSIPKSMKFAGEKVNLDDIDLFERLDRELASQVYTHGNTLLTIKRANRYFPIMEPILKERGVHPDYLYLACIESNLNPTARSGAGAAGIWQFMPATAKEYGLEVNDEVDERYDLEKETVAACRFINASYDRYSDWASVAASYNGGQGRVSSELRNQQVGSALDLWLAEETMRYPMRMLAMKMIMENPSAYGFNLKADQLYQPYDCDIVEVSGSVSDWPTWAKNHDTDYETLRVLNPWIRAKRLTNRSGKTYRVKVPKPDSMSRSKLKHKTYNRNWVH